MFLHFVKTEVRSLKQASKSKFLSDEVNVIKLKDKTVAMVEPGW